jgi:hypothetical protein
MHKTKQFLPWKPRTPRILFVVSDNGIKTTKYLLKGKYNYYFF